MNQLVLNYDDGTNLVLVPRSTTGGVFIRNITVPMEGKFARAKHDQECEEMGYRSRTAGENDSSPNKALPETVHTNPVTGEEFIRMEREQIELQIALFAKAHPGLTRVQLEEIWANSSGNSVAYTDRNARDSGDRFYGGDPTKNFRDDVLGVNLHNPKAVGWKVLLMGGALVRMLDSVTFEAVDPNSVPKRSDFQTEELFLAAIADLADYIWRRPWLFHWAVETTNQKLDFMRFIDGRWRPVWRVSQFPQMKKYGTGLPVINWGVGGRNRFKEKWRILRMENSVEYTPYIP